MRGEQRERDAVHLLADGVVLLAELDQLAQLALELPAPVPQREDLPLADRDGASAVRVRDVDLRQRLGVVLEELRVLLQIAGDFLGFHRSPVEPVASCKLQVTSFDFEPGAFKLATLQVDLAFVHCFRGAGHHHRRGAARP